MTDRSMISRAVSTTDAGNITNSSSRSVSNLVAAASVGGVSTGGSSGFKSAFKIDENKDDPSLTLVSLGSLIPGSLPRWNIWSPNAPGFIAHASSKPQVTKVYNLTCNLNNRYGKYATNYKYCFQLGGFRDYDSTSRKPDYKIITTRNGIKTNVQVLFNFGSYNWAELFLTSVDNIGVRVDIFDKTTNTKLGTIDGIELSIDGLEYDRSGSLSIDKPYGTAWIECDVLVASYQRIDEPGKPYIYTMIQAASFSELLGNIIIDDRSDMQSTGTVDTKLIYIDLKSVTVSSSILGRGYTDCNISYRFPEHLSNGLPNPLPPQKYNKLYVTVTDMITLEVLHTENFNIQLVEYQSDLFLATTIANVNYAYKPSNLLFAFEYKESELES